MNVLRKLQIETIARPTKSDMCKVGYNSKNYPGFHYDAYGAMRTKKEAILDAFKIASKRWDTIEKGSFKRNDIFPSLYTIGARNKRDYTYEDNELAKSRVVHMPDFHTELTSGVWTDAITDSLLEKGNGPIFIGNSLVKFERLEKLFKDSLCAFEGDWKRFDSSLYINIIIAALCIVRCYFDRSHEIIDDHFISILDDCGIKDYYLLAGQVVRACNGLPSGIKATNLLGSIINLIALDYCINDGKNRNFNFAAGGDDFAIAVKAGANIEALEESFSRRATDLGMKVKFLDRKSSESAKLSSFLCFYKYVVKEGKPYVPIASMLERVFMPWNKRYKSGISMVKFLNDVLPSLGTPATHLLMYYKYYCIICNKYMKTQYKVQDVIKQHIQVHNKMMNKREFPMKDREDLVEKSTVFKDLNYINDTHYYYGDALDEAVSVIYNKDYKDIDFKLLDIIPVKAAFPKIFELSFYFN